MSEYLPIVSVIISTYNRRARLERAVRSVLGQGFAQFEIIIVDNASEDDTQEYVKSINDPRVRYIKDEINKGGPAARNTGIRNSRAGFIALLDDDDEFLPDKLDKQVKKFLQTSVQVGLLYTGSEIFNEQKQSITKINRPIYRGDVYRRLLLSNIFPLNSTLIKKECFDKVGFFDETLSSCQDWDMWMRIAREYEFDYIPEVLARVNEHEDQISTNYSFLIPGRIRMVNKHRDEFEKYPEIFVIHLKRIGKLHCLNGTWLKATGWFKEAISINLLEIFKIAAWFIFEFPWVGLFSQNKNIRKFK